MASAAAKGAGDPTSYAEVSALYAKARALKEKEEAEALARRQRDERKGRELSVAEKRNAVKTRVFKKAWGWSMGFFGWLL